MFSMVMRAVFVITDFRVRCIILVRVHTLAESTELLSSAVSSGEEMLKDPAASARKDRI